SDRAREATTLNNIGAVYRAIGQPQQALTYLQQALPIWREVSDRSEEANTLNNIGAGFQLSSDRSTPGSLNILTASITHMAGS
ncbi:tetratricopeptide repeat protein, partial [Arthrospira platensis SPKY2]